jgi:hypothetical protein
LKKDAAAFIDNSAWYCSLDYQTLDGWSCSRRVVAKVEYGYEEVDTRFVVTSLPVNKIPPGLMFCRYFDDVSIKLYKIRVIQVFSSHL